MWDCRTVGAGFVDDSASRPTPVKLGCFPACSCRNLFVNRVFVSYRAGITLDDLQTVSGQGSGSWKSKDIVMPLAHDILDVTIATVAGIVAVSVFFPVYLVAVLVRTIVRRAKPSPTT
jgi:hypothetical protein